MRDDLYFTLKRLLRTLGNASSLWSDTLVSYVYVVTNANARDAVTVSTTP